jgi:hypothetical protein
MKNKLFNLAAAGILAVAFSHSAPAAFITIAPGMKAIYTNEIVEGKVVVVGALTVSSFDQNNNVVFKTYKEMIVPGEGSEPPKKTVSEIAMTVSPQLNDQGQPIAGQYTVETVTTITTTPVDASGAPVGDPVVTTPPAVVQNNVTEVAAPPTSDVAISTSGLGTTPAVSGQ